MAASTGDCLSCASRLVGLCAPLDAAVLGEIASDASRLSLRARDTIFFQGDPATHVYTLVEGSARLTRLLPDGRRAAIGFRFPGDLLGFTPAREYAFGAEALTPATVCRVDRERLDRMFRSHPPLERRFLDLCARELAATQELVLALGRFTAEERVAGFLVSLAEAHEQRGWTAPVLELSATRGDVGELLGLTLETVSRVFSAFRRRGWIRLHGQSGVELVATGELGALARGGAGD